MIMASDEGTKVVFPYLVLHPRLRYRDGLGAG